MNFALRILVSTKFAAAVIATIIVLSAFGTIYPGGDAVFGSWIFFIFVGLLAVSTASCSLTRIFPLWRTITQPIVEVSDQFLQTLPYYASISNINISQIKVHLKRYKCYEGENSGSSFLFAQKGRIGRFGPHIAHFGVLILLLGVVVGAAYGYANPYNDKIVVIPIEGSLQVNDFYLRLNYFNVSYYDSGAVREYRAVVTIIDDDKVQTRDITVNGPLTYEGITFYLYGYDAEGILDSGKASWVAFEIKSDAGVPLIWIGAAVTLVGIMLSLYISHQRIWIKWSEDSALLGAITNKNSRRFFRDMDNLLTELERSSHALHHVQD